MQYRVGWLDATLQKNYTSQKDLKKCYLQDGLVVTELEKCGDGWYDLEVCHTFQAKTNQEAIVYLLNFFNSYHRDIGAGTGVFTLKGLDNDFYFTEEDLERR